MPQQQIAIQTLREKFSQSRGEKLGRQAMTYWQLILHPDLEWIDLLSALDRPDVISDDAALNLHLLFTVHREGVAVERRKVFWEAKIEEAGLDVAARISDWVSGSEELSVAWKRSRDAVQVIDASDDGSGSGV